MSQRTYPSYTRGPANLPMTNTSAYYYNNNNGGGGGSFAGMGAHMPPMKTSAMTMGGPSAYAAYAAHAANMGSNNMRMMGGVYGGYGGGVMSQEEDSMRMHGDHGSSVSMMSPHAVYPSAYPRSAVAYPQPMYASGRY